MRIPAPARQLVKRALARTGYALVPNARYSLVPRDHNSPLPDLERLDERFWQTPRSMLAVDLAIDEAVELLTGSLAPSLGEFVRPYDRACYTFATGSYPILDAESLYAIVRWLKPRKVVELVSRAAPETVARLVPGFSLAYMPGAFWIERVAES